MASMCKVTFGVLSGHSVITEAGKSYVWSKQQGLHPAAGWHLGMWIQMETTADFQMEDEHPFDKITAHIEKEVAFVRFMANAEQQMDPKAPAEDRARMLPHLEALLAQHDWLKDRALGLFLKDPPPFGYDLTIAPKEGQVGEIFAQMLQKFGKTTLGPLPSEQEAAQLAVERGYLPTPGNIAAFQQEIARNTHYHGTLNDLAEEKRQRKNPN